MATAPFNSLERVFSRRDLFRGKPLRALLWGGLAAVALLFLLLDVFLVADLLETRGLLELSGPDMAEFHRLLAPAKPVTSDEAAEQQAAVAPAPSLQAMRPSSVGGGLRPSAWRLRHKALIGRLLTAGSRRFAWLRDNGKTLILLTLTGFVIACLRGFCVWRAEKVSTSAALDVGARLRRTLHRQTLRLGPGDLTDPEGKQVVGLFTTEVDAVRDGIQTWILRIARHSPQLVALVLLALLVNWRVALQCLILLGGCWYLVQRQRLRFAAARRLEESRAESRLRLLAEGLRKTRIVRGYGMEDFEHHQFQDHLDKFRGHVAHVLDMQHYMRLAIWCLVLACMAAVSFLVGSKVLHSSETTPEFSFSAALLMMAIIAGLPRPLAELWELRGIRKRASHAAERIYRYLNQVPAVSQAVGARFLDPLSEHIRFEAVSFTLDNRRKLLDAVDVTLTAGEVIAVVSFDPLEARAFGYLLPRFIEPQAGRILFNNEDIAWGTLESLRAEAVFVGGGDPFFTATVADNIVCSNNSYTLPDVMEAAKTAHAHNFILKLSQGYETVIGEHGEHLDAGQGFRLGLARAVLRDPALMIIEEPAEALDEDTKSLLDDSYNRIVRGRTVIFLPNRLSSLRRADTVVFLHHGKVESQGSYQELVRSSSLFRHWEYMHFNQFRRDLEPASVH